ncbi:MAG: HEAT repeat domain-containing protein [Planctomycetaceae bacterium]
MTDSDNASPEGSADAPAPMDSPGAGLPAAPLPPIEPPSAGFIVQLFVVPAVIVAAVIAIYLLFGKLASSDVDWRELVVDLRSSNSHARWRERMGWRSCSKSTRSSSVNRVRRARRAMMPPHSRSHSLSQDPELAAELAVTLSQTLDQADQEGEEHQKLVEYLIKSIGWMDVPDAVLPVLRKGIEDRRNDWQQQQSLIAIGMVAGRARERGEPITDDELTADLLRIIDGEAGVRRHLATYNLGFMANETAQSRLRSLITDPDVMTRINAATGLAREGSLEALPVFEGILRDASTEVFDPRRSPRTRRLTRTLRGRSRSPMRWRAW